ncbi:MAG: hypothetical protein HC898_00805 [Phycisphaerales bacterium]|nr:hypothetical protein [Phycisphaerales bacterium]
MPTSTNDGWFARSHQPWQHLQIASLRSIELGMPTARAVNTGISGFINSSGRIEKLVVTNGLSQDVAGVAIHELALDPRSTFYGKWGDLPIRSMVMMTGALLFMTLIKVRFSRKPATTK